MERGDKVARSRLLWYRTEAKALMHDIEHLNQMDIAHEINESQQTVSYRIKKVYPQVLEDLIRILNLAGYEIVNKGD